MTFAAPDSLSELVWSPHNGLSLKCAECSLADKKPFLLWNVGPSNMVPSPSQGIRCNGADGENKIEGNLIISSKALHLHSEISQSVSLMQSATNNARPPMGSSHGQDMGNRDEMVKGKIEKGILVKHRSENADHPGEGGKELCDRPDEQMAYMAERSQKNTDPIGSNIDMAKTEALYGNLNTEISCDFNPIVHKAANGGQNLEELVTAAEIHTEIPTEAHVSPLQIFMVLDEPDKEVKRAIEEKRTNTIKKSGFMVPSAEKLEHTAENDLQYAIREDAYHQSEARLFRGCFVPLETSTGNGSSHLCPLKVKDKGLSDGSVGRRFSHDVDDSQESVESCNTAGLLGKRQWNFDQQLIGESKRIKNQMDGCPASTSIIKHDSSFVNWITNMVNGFSKSNQEEVPSLDLTLAHSNHENTSILHETIICREHQESVSRNMGFQTIFRSLYCPSTKIIETRVSRDDCSEERLQDLVQADKNNVQNSPISSPLQNGVSFNHHFMANENIFPSSTEVVAGQSDRAWNLSAITPIQNDFMTFSAENKAPSNQEWFQAKHDISLSDSLGNHKITVAENDNELVASDDRATYDLSNKSNLFGSLWIARFSTKTSGTSLNLNHSKIVNCQAINCPCDCTRPNPETQTHPGPPIEQKYSDIMVNTNKNSGDLGKELQTFSVNAEFSLGFKEMHDHNYPNSVLKLNSILPSQGSKSSEAMASMFARRLDALKHIIPSETRNDATCTEPTCYYCGKSGHSLLDCSEVVETEIEYLLRSMSSYDWPEDSPLFCIRCFQLDHWAIMCPVMNSSRQQQLENKVSSGNCLNASNQRLCSGNERNSCFLAKKDHLKVAACSREEPFVNTDLRNPTSNAQEFSGKRSLGSNETQKQLTSSSGENKFGEQHNLPSFNLVSMKIAELPKGMFNAVRRLQVSRADILKWINSNVSLSHLEGLFLRLRLGQWEEGLGGTGYYVACITEQDREPAKDSKTSISVSVGGIKCLVGSQYISNHDFLEDELMVWWSRTLKSGEKIPSTEDLEIKFKQRIILGF
ncbi:hypothetical protein ACH5RR_033090 [Cinchona calisaya]|uniref:CCHC-type domain-containing protein n=1 Tax=Cinchona calisaya TaxID=153742 RepID=A0ABD2YQ89_9GENT